MIKKIRKLLICSKGPMIILLLGVILFLMFSISRINQTVAHDELFWYTVAKTSIETGTPRFFFDYSKTFYHHPYLYMWLLTPCLKYISYDEIGARVPGVLFGVLTIFTVFFVCKAFSSVEKNSAWPCLSALYFSLIPCMVQSAVIIEVDTAFLIFIILCQCACFAHYQINKKFIWLALLAISTCLALLARISTPIITTFILMCLQLFMAGSRKEKVYGILSLFSGIILFLIIWGVYCRYAGFYFLGPILYTIEAFTTRTVGGDSSSLFSYKKYFINFIQFNLWSGICFIWILLIGIFFRIKDFLKQKKIYAYDSFFIVGMILLMGYFIMGGSVFGFIKYQCPAFPLIVIWCFSLFSKEKIVNSLNLYLFIIFCLIGIFLQYFLLGDLLYFFRYTLKEALAFDQPVMSLLIKQFIRILIAFFIAAGVMLVIWRTFRKSTLLAFVALSIGMCFAENLIQSSADYHTGYVYGLKGNRKLVAYLKNNIENDKIIIAPAEVINAIQFSNSGYIKDSIWEDQDKLFQLLISPNTRCFIYSVPTNTIGQIHFLNKNTKIKALLDDMFVCQKIGSFWIWIKKETIPVKI